MKALWRNRPPSFFRERVAAYVAMVVAFASAALLFVPQIAWASPALAFAASFAAAWFATKPGAVRTQEVELVPTTEGVVVVHVGKPVLALRSEDLLGVSTCAGLLGADLAVTHRAQPHRSLVFEDIDLSEVDPLRRALGLPQGGFGGAVLPQGRGHVLGAFPRFGTFVAAMVFTLLCVMGAVMDDPAPLVILAQYAVGAFAILVWFSQDATRNAQRRGRKCVLQPYGLQYWKGDAIATIPYADILDVADTAAGVEIRSRNGLRAQVPLDSVTAAERAHWRRQIQSARDRAAENISSPGAVDAAASLVRARGEPLRSWLQRVDALNVLPVGEGHYRQAGVSEPELWRALEDPDTPMELRIAISRRLGRRDAPSRARVEAASKRLHTADDRARLRVAVDVDVAQVPDFVDDLLMMSPRDS